MANLTDKEATFLERYLTHFNGARAAREAGVPEDQAKQYAYRLRSKAYFKEKLAEHMGKTAMTADEALARLAAMAAGDAPTKTVGTTEHFDEIEALKLIGKAHALFIDKKVVDVSGLELVDGEA